jgi:hypothetical protein
VSPGVYNVIGKWWTKVPLVLTKTEHADNLPHPIDRAIDEAVSNAPGISDGEHEAIGCRELVHARVLVLDHREGR